MSRFIDRIGLGVGALLLIIGSFMTWVSVDLGFTSFSAAGTDNIEGKLTVAAGGVVLVIGAALLAGRMPVVPAGLAALVATGFGAVVLLLEYLDVRERIAEAEGTPASAVVGAGVWTAAAGAIVALLSATWIAARNRA
jgi:hypothetical protein